MKLMYQKNFSLCFWIHNIKKHNSVLSINEKVRDEAVKEQSFCDASEVKLV